MSDFESQPDQSPLPLGGRSASGRKSAIDWQRVNTEPEPHKPGILGWAGRLCWRAFKWLVLLLLTPIICYLLAGGVGAWLSVNPDFEPTPDGIEIFIYSGNAHSEFILPLTTPGKDWSTTFQLANDAPMGQSNSLSHIAIGWGDRQFYTQTQQWQDLEPVTALKAMLLPTPAVLHVEHVATPYSTDLSVPIKISTDQYDRLCQSIESTIADPQPIDGLAFGQHDQFYEAEGEFHLLNTCNNWVGNAMKEAGIRVGRFTPLPKTVFWHLEN